MAMTGLVSGDCTKALSHVRNRRPRDNSMRRKPSFSAFVDSSTGMGTVAHSTVRMYVPLEFLVRSEIIARDRSGPFHRRQGLDIMGWSHLPELRMDFVFRRHDHGKEDPADQWGAATIVPPGFRLPIPGQSMDRKDPDRRDLWVLTSEPRRQPPWLEHYAGPCEQHVLTFVRPVQTQATLDVSCQCEEGDDQQGTKVEVWGNVMFERPLSMRLMLRNGERSHGPAAMDGKEMVVIPSGTRVPIERQSVTVAVGRRPWISMRVSDGEGRVLCPEHTLGYSMRFW
jgi:hypothetical protein